MNRDGNYIKISRRHGKNLVHHGAAIEMGLVTIDGRPHVHLRREEASLAYVATAHDRERINEQTRTR